MGHHSGRLAFVRRPPLSARLPPPRPRPVPTAPNSQVISWLFKGPVQYIAPLFGLRQKTYAGRRAATWAQRSRGWTLPVPPLRGFGFLPSPACAPSPFRGTAPVLAGDRIRPGEGTWAPGEEAGGQPLVRTGRSLCVRTQCDCAGSSPTMPSPFLAASEAGITCAHVRAMEPPLGGGRGRCRRWRAPTSHKGPIGAVHRFPRRRGRPRGPRGRSGLHTPTPQRQMLAVPRRSEEANRGRGCNGAMHFARPQQCSCRGETESARAEVVSRRDGPARSTPKTARCGRRRRVAF